MEFKHKENAESASSELKIECSGMPELLAARFGDLVIRLAQDANDLGIGLKSLSVTLYDRRVPASETVEAAARESRIGEGD